VAQRSARQRWRQEPKRRHRPQFQRHFPKHWLLHFDRKPGNNVKVDLTFRGPLVGFGA
jgi:hypothetical protein